MLAHALLMVLTICITRLTREATEKVHGGQRDKTSIKRWLQQAGTCSAPGSDQLAAPGFWVSRTRLSFFMATCRMQPLFVQICGVSVRYLLSLKEKNTTFVQEEKGFYKIMDPVTLFYLCKVPVVNKCLAFLSVTKYNFYAINYIS